MRTKTLLFLLLLLNGCDKGPRTAPSSTVKEEPIVKPSCAPEQKGTTVRMIVTSYDPGPCCCAPYADGVTASGYRIKPFDRLIAAPKNIPFGTMIYIPGYGTYPVLDRGGSIKWNRLDVLFTEEEGGHQRALQWGRQTLDVVIYK